MIRYLEIIKISEIQPAEEIRIEVIDDDDARQKLEELAVLFPKFLSDEYEKRIHICRHDEGLPCETYPLQ